MKKLELNEILSNEEYLKHRDSIRKRHPRNQRATPNSRRRAPHVPLRNNRYDAVPGPRDATCRRS